MKLSMKTTFYWSLGGHAAFFILLLIVSLITSCTRSRAPKEVHVFRLQAGPPAPKVAVATPPSQQPTPVTPTPPQKEEVKPQPKKETPKPEVKKTEPKSVKKTEPKPVSYDDFLKENKLPEPKPAERQPDPTPPTATVQPDPNLKLRKELEQIIQGFGGTDTSSDQMQEFNLYIGQLRTQLNRLWLQPDNLPPGKWNALIEFTVERNGKVMRVHFKQKSGNYDFDQSLIRAMNAFVTTAPPPGGKAQVFTIPFSMTVR